MMSILVKSITYVAFLSLSLGCAALDSGPSREGEAQSKEPQVFSKKSEDSSGEVRVRVAIKPEANPQKQIAVKKAKTDVSAVSAKKDIGIERIKTVLSKYKKSSGVQMKANKSVYIALMEDTKISEGSILMSKGNFRFDVTSPEPSTLVVLSDVVWLESRFGDDVQVSRMSLDGRSSSKGLLGLFFEKESLWNGYRLVKAKTEEPFVAYTLVPQKKNKHPEATRIEVKLNKKKLEINKLTYWDDLENKTTIEFLDIKFDVKIDSKKFQYAPPIGASVTNY